MKVDTPLIHSASITRRGRFFRGFPPRDSNCGTEFVDVFLHESKDCWRRPLIRATAPDAFKFRWLWCFHHDDGLPRRPIALRCPAISRNGVTEDQLRVL